MCAAVIDEVPRPQPVNILIGNTPVDMQIDSICAQSIMSKDKFEDLKLGTLKILEIPLFIYSYVG